MSFSFNDSLFQLKPFELHINDGLLEGTISGGIKEPEGRIKMSNFDTEILTQFLNDEKVSKIDILKSDNIEIGSYIRNTIQADKARSREEALFEIFKILRPGEPPTIETAEGSVIVTDAVAEQPLALVTTQVYVPATNPVA